ncbi:MAG: DinB family protein [Bacteroidota bacterium]
MSLTQNIAKHLRDIHFGGNWTVSCMKDALTGLTWEQASTKVYDFNTIAVLTYHTTYYVAALLEVLQGKPLNAKDEYSFNLPPIRSQHDWEQLLDKAWMQAEQAAQLIEKLPDSQLLENFTDEKYGNYYRNIQGNIEHMHYHLGQIVLIKKIVLKMQG